jgi:cytochrome d ubiquinol oxidase subunit II
MFENLSYLELQQYWWIIISILGTLLVNAIGRKWDLTFTTLVTFGGAFFASFPLFYSTSFGGAYWVWILILFSFVVQAVSYEYRKKPNNFLGQKTFDTFLLINGLLATILIGSAVGTFFTGSEFSVDKLRLTNITNPAISRWETPFHGLEAVLNLTNLALGLSVFFLSRILGILYFNNSIEEKNILKNSNKHLKYNAFPFLIVFLLFIILLITKQGFAVNPVTKIITMEDFKYLHNFLEMPVVLIIFVIGVIGILVGIFITLYKKSRRGIWFSGIGTILTVFTLFLIAGFNKTAFYPSTFDLQSSLTIENSSSSFYTLTVMSYVSLLVPFVIAYIWHAWRSINKRKIDIADIQQDEMKY